VDAARLVDVIWSVVLVGFVAVFVFAVFRRHADDTVP
jgi:hypothetical protein